MPTPVGDKSSSRIEPPITQAQIDQRKDYQQEIESRFLKLTEVMKPLPKYSLSPKTISILGVKLSNFIIAVGNSYRNWRRDSNAEPHLDALVSLHLKTGLKPTEEAVKARVKHLKKSAEITHQIVALKSSIQADARSLEMLKDIKSWYDRTNPSDNDVTFQRNVGEDLNNNAKEIRGLFKKFNMEVPKYISKGYFIPFHGDQDIRHLPLKDINQLIEHLQAGISHKKACVGQLQKDQGKADLTILSPEQRNEDQRIAKAYKDAEKNIKQAKRKELQKVINITKENIAVITNVMEQLKHEKPGEPRSPELVETLKINKDIFKFYLPTKGPARPRIGPANDIRETEFNKEINQEIEKRNAKFNYDCDHPETAKFTALPYIKKEMEKILKELEKR